MVSDSGISSEGIAPLSSGGSYSPCPHYPACGGCQSLELDYAEQLNRKQAVAEGLFDAAFMQLAKQGQLPDIHRILPSPSSEGYRHKVMLPFGRGEQTSPSVTLGCFAKNSHVVVDQESCRVQEPELTHCALAIKAWAKEWRLAVYDEATHSGWLRHAVLRKALGTGEILAGLVVNGAGPEHPLADLGNVLRKTLGTRAEALKGIVLNLQTERTNVVLGSHIEEVEGRSFIEENLDGLRFRLRLNSFFQVNPQQAKNLFATATAGLGDGHRVLDLYSGAGTLTLWAARQGAQCQGWEENAFAVQSAQEAATVNGLSERSEFLLGDVVQGLKNKGNHAVAGFDALIVDPPRKGLEKPVLEAILESGPERLTYVSCNPNSLKRDVMALASKYRIESLQPIDMMPHTRHIEIVAKLRRWG